MAECDTCDGDGYHDPAPWKDRPPLDFSHLEPCPDCQTPCGICENHGYYFDTEESAAKRCPACWRRVPCETCDGAGEYEDGFVDPNDGHLVGGVVTCDVCDGTGYHRQFDRIGTPSKGWGELPAGEGILDRL